MLKITIGKHLEMMGIFYIELGTLLEKNKKGWPSQSHIYFLFNNYDSLVLIIKLQLLPTLSVVEFTMVPEAL